MVNLSLQTPAVNNKDKKDKPKKIDSGRRPFFPVPMSYSQAVKKQMNPNEMMSMMMAQFQMMTQQNEALLKERSELQKKLADAQSESRSIPEEDEIVPLLLNVLANVRPVNVTSGSVHCLLQALGHSAPERFKQIGGIHHDESGTRTYITVRLYTDPEMEKRYTVIHVYLFIRGYSRKITSVDVYYKDHTDTIAFNPEWKHEYQME